MTAQSADKLGLLISFEKRFDSTVQILQQMELKHKEKTRNNVNPYMFPEKRNTYNLY